MPSITKPLVAIVGPTAVGKTEWSLAAAEALGGEIVGADSRQVYRAMDIGTAKPTRAERARVPHHLIDILDPDEVLGVAEYVRLARAAIDGIHARGHLPMLVGGTGQYVWALLEGWTVPAVPADPAKREAFEAEAARLGPAALHARLAVLDPEAAARIDPRNVRRTVRALEVIEATGRPFSAQGGKVPPPYTSFVAGLWRPRVNLYARVDARVDAMMAEGLLAEVQALVARGYGWGLPSMLGVGYRQLDSYLRGEIGLPEAVALVKRATRRFIRHQSNWFARDDPRVRWFEAGRDVPGDLVNAVRAWLDSPAEAGSAPAVG